MNNSHRKLTIAITALLGLGASGILFADTPFPAQRNSAASCASVKWHQEMVEDFPKVIAACREVLTTKDGDTWARFESRLERVESDGTVKVGVEDSRGKRVDQVSLQPSMDQVAYIDGRETEFRSLEPGQVLNLYIPEGGKVFSTHTDISAVTLVPVKAPMLPAAPVRYDPQLASVQFALDSSELTPATMDVLDMHARSLVAHSGTTLLVIGHTSASAAAAYNQRLSERRAKTVMNYLAGKPGVDSRNITTVGYGEMRPIAREASMASVTSKEAMANMRVEFQLAAE